MSTTKELITLLQKQFKGWNRDGDRGILPYLNIAQRILCSVEAEQLMIIDESTGKLPAITTVDGTYTYNLPANVNFISSILIESGTIVSSHNVPMQDYGDISRIHRRPEEEVSISGISYYLFPYIRSYPSNEENVAKVVFTENPGNSTNVYRYRGYSLPTSLVSESIALSIPPPYDFIYLLPATAKLLEGVQNGNYVEAIAYITKEFLPEMHKAFNVGAYGINCEPESHGF